jgi:hypothetical protein
MEAWTLRALLCECPGFRRILVQTSHGHLKFANLNMGPFRTASRLPASTRLVPDITRIFASIGTSMAQQEVRDHTLP